MAAAVTRVARGRRDASPRSAGFRAREWNNKIPGGCAEWCAASEQSLRDAGYAPALSHPSRAPCCAG